jgi:hypothetical protein
MRTSPIAEASTLNPTPNPPSNRGSPAHAHAALPVRSAAPRTARDREWGAHHARAGDRTGSEGRRRGGERQREGERGCDGGGRRACQSLARSVAVAAGRRRVARSGRGLFPDLRPSPAAPAPASPNSGNPCGLGNAMGALLPAAPGAGAPNRVVLRPRVSAPSFAPAAPSSSALAPSSARVLRRREPTAPSSAAERGPGRRSRSGAGRQPPSLCRNGMGEGCFVVSLGSWRENPRMRVLGM